jgi:hypothetical protein
MSDYFAYNGPMVTTSAAVPVTTGTAVKTMLQVKAPTAKPILVWKWGVLQDGTGTTPNLWSVLHTGAINATVTAHVAAGVQPYGAVQSASAVQLGTAATGYTASAEGSIVATRYGDITELLPGQSFYNEWSLGREFFVPAGEVVRIRVDATVAVNALCYLMWSE